MVFSYCCFRKLKNTQLYCAYRFKTGYARIKIKRRHVREQFEEFVGGEVDRFDPSDDDAFCRKCYSKVRRGSNTTYPEKRRRIQRISGQEDVVSPQMITRSKASCARITSVVDPETPELNECEDHEEEEPIRDDADVSNENRVENEPGVVEVEVQSEDHVVQKVVNVDSLVDIQPEMKRGDEVNNNAVAIQLVIPESNVSQISSLSSQSIIASQNQAIIEIETVGWTQSRCFLCNNLENRRRIPQSAILQVLKQLVIFIPPTNRACPTHLQNGCFTKDSMKAIKATKSSFRMDGPQITVWIKQLIEALNKQSAMLEFSQSSQFSDEEFFLLLGVTRNQFFEIFEKCKSHLHHSKNRSKENAVAVLLMKLRLDVSQNVLSLLFGFSSQARVSSTISHVTEVMDKCYAVDHVGYAHIDREEAKKHTSDFFDHILGTPPGRVRLSVDCTYIYIQEPTNMKLQRQTFSLHKYRNLVKPVMQTFDDNYIYSADGIWRCDASNNDAAILKKILAKKGNDSMQSILEKGDSFLVDRGYRDCVKDLEECGYTVFMPSLLSKGKCQFSTIEANKSRQVTMLRCHVEMTNGMLKNRFRLLDHIVQNSYLPLLPAFVRITSAIHNHFGTRFNEYPKNADEIIAKLHENMLQNNMLQEYVEENQLLKKRVCWRNVEEGSLQGFPVVTKDDVELLMLGTFQVKMGAKYTEQQLEGESGYEISAHKDRDDLFRARLKFRFNKRVTHQVWLEVVVGGVGRASIKAYYCTCKTGSRTVGSCAHVASVLMHFGCHRGQAPVPKRKMRALELLNAAVGIADDDAEQDETDCPL